MEHTHDVGDERWYSDCPACRLEEAAPALLEACKEVAELVEIARGYFPKSMHNSDKFQLEKTCAAIGSAIAQAEKGD